MFDNRRRTVSLLTEGAQPLRRDLLRGREPRVLFANFFHCRARIIASKPYQRVPDHGAVLGVAIDWISLAWTFSCHEGADNGQHGGDISAALNLDHA